MLRGCATTVTTSMVAPKSPGTVPTTSSTPMECVRTAILTVTIGRRDRIKLKKARELIRRLKETRKLRHRGNKTDNLYFIRLIEFLIIYTELVYA